MPGEYLAEQLIRSSFSTPLNYGEAQAAESRKDFIHKMKLVLKELRECKCNVKLIEATSLTGAENEHIKTVLSEADQLIAIFTKSIITAKSKSEN
jgi:four helix bundle protein